MKKDLLWYCFERYERELRFHHPVKGIIFLNGESLIAVLHVPFQVESMHCLEFKLRGMEYKNVKRGKTSKLSLQHLMSIISLLQEWVGVLGGLTRLYSLTQS